MAQEIAEIPAAVERFVANRDVINRAADRIRTFAPQTMVFCGRGSSGQVGVYLKYLFETRLGLLTSAAAPSVMTAYDARVDMRGSLFIVVSQSGRSPDLIATTERARAQHALTLAIVNDAHGEVPNRRFVFGIWIRPRSVDLSLADRLFQVRKHAIFANRPGTNQGLVKLVLQVAIAN